EEIAEYFETLRALKKEYENDIRILIGFEAEYYPDVFEDFLAHIEPFSPDYLIMGQHALDNEVTAHFPSRATDDPALLKKYVDQVITGLSTGKFLYHAHPDMMNFIGDESVYRAETLRYLTFCKEHHIPIEINLLGMMESRWYPREDFWQMAGEVGNTAIIGCDAHQPTVLSDVELHQKGEKWAERFGVSLVANPIL
ncbi:MAG: histidinol phosphate phosphatase, partial [Clostridia bacterium]|nr:histidinol phosphate phosphatase [Clostridia bacterium]